MKITQAEARRLKRRVRELDSEKKALYFAWRSETMDGMVYLGESLVNSPIAERIRAARWLKHPVGCMVSGDKVEFYATREALQ